MIMISPRGTVRYPEPLRLPKITVDVKKKRIHPNANLSIPNSHLIKLDDSIFPLSHSRFPSPKKLRSKKKKHEDPNSDEANLQKSDSKSYIISQNLEQLHFDHYPTYSPSKIASPKHSKTPAKKQLNISLGSKLGLADFQYINTPVLQLPKSFKIKKSPKKNLASIYPSSVYEKYFLHSDKLDTERLGKMLKSSKTPGPENKIPKYIRHESYKAGYFLSKIDKVLSRIRVYRSKSSMHGHTMSKNTFRALEY
ncbi:hypothetical protein SteCoe_13249 [Stentor coeruleus]|uniref:Uncharacterized protein n=1 Tax=Stentor coeruleus TaxID=5963 RepID=A0A1R2C8T1_9CILI|nr:hypothetical protein SteCoe_13249 [Stentor coeruleus]